MATHQILHGLSTYPLYGKNGTLLYSYPVTMSASVTISWTGGKDVDICAFYNAVSGTIGYSYENGISSNGFVANWTSGDNTTGGPETISLAYDGSRPTLKGVTFDIHANSFSVGTDAALHELPGGGGEATITVRDKAGKTYTCQIMPASRKGACAQASDPGVRIYFNSNGTVKEIANC